MAQEVEKTESVGTQLANQQISLLNPFLLKFSDAINRILLK